MQNSPTAQPSTDGSPGHDNVRPRPGHLRRLSFKRERTAIGLGIPAGNGHHQIGPAAPMTLRADGKLDRHSLGFMVRYLRPGDAVLDIGASTGAHAIAAGQLVGPAGRVDALEPSPTVRARLIENIAHNKLKSVIVVHNLMAGATAGLGRFVDGSGKSGRRRPPMPGELATRVIGVEMARLEQFMGTRRYALMCLDIAGGEFSALRGGEAQLRAGNPPAILLAIDSALTDFGVTADLLVDWLDERGYELTLYDVDRNMIDYPETPWRQRRVVLAMARTARNGILRRLADSAPGGAR